MEMDIPGEEMWTEPQEEKDGLFDLAESKACKDPLHDINNHVVIPIGKGYRHTCPGCGKKTIIHNVIN